ncbi:MAG: hypothetical protein K8J08_10945 [Thermoanaerobaculia bacterium]|nr:hypothetical protein [Thermoanaerobaculia bacterium]
MSRFEEQLKLMLRGQLAEPERQEFEGGFLACESREDVLDRAKEVEGEIVRAWKAEELEPEEAVVVLAWIAARHRRLLVEALNRKAVRLEERHRPNRGPRWVM